MQDIDSINCPIHSFETFGAVDGPGIRFVIFTQGCNLQCKYCQNRDTWAHQGGTIYSVREVLDKIERYKNYIIPSGGGVTVSGGEPLLHIDFLIALFEELKKKGFSTAIDTSGVISITDKVDKLIDLTRPESGNINVCNKEEDLLKLKEFISSLKTVDKVDFLAYHDMGKFKWTNLGLSYPLEGVRVATQDDIDRAKKIFA